MTIDSKLIQPTDLYPNTSKLLWKLLSIETAHVLISILPFIPKEYITKASEEMGGKLDILSVFDRGLLWTLIQSHKTNYYYILRFQNKVSYFQLWIYILKFYKFSRYIKEIGLDFHLILKSSRRRHPSYHIGKIIDCDLERLLPDNEFDVYDKDILMLFEKGPLKTLWKLRHTSYYQIQRKKRKKSLGQTLRWTFKYYNLFHAMSRKGFKVANHGLKSYPWLFASPQVTMRLDGHHRCAVAKHLRMQKLPTLVITIEDLTGHPGIDPEMLSRLRQDLSKMT